MQAGEAQGGGRLQSMGVCCSCFRMAGRGFCLPAHAAKRRGSRHTAHDRTATVNKRLCCGADREKRQRRHHTPRRAGVAFTQRYAQRRQAADALYAAKLKKSVAA